MGEEQPSAYYDRIYNTARKYRRHYSGVRWRAMFEKAAQRCGQHVLELGCGVGQFAHMLYDKGWLFYRGVDFSPVAIQRARSWKTKGFSFEVKDIYLPGTYHPQGFDYDTVVALETLEHVRDLEVLEMIPPGKRLVFSLPTFDNEAHLIHFTDVAGIIDRYRGYMSVDYIERISDWFLFTGIKKQA